MTRITVSIHAPLRGATRQGRAGLADHGRFNPRPSARGDRRAPRPCSSTRRFNPRPSARGDLLLQTYRGVAWVSIHAPLRGATHAVAHGDDQLGFQSTPLCEGRRLDIAPPRSSG